MSIYDQFDELKATECYKVIEKGVEKFVKDEIAKHQKSIVGIKTIHDPIWGSVIYSTWEMEIIDTPFLQRLRNIHQVGLAMLTYPSARHSRFEHSLGTNTAAKRMCNSINNNSDDIKISLKKQNEICLAALLHDIGHCFFSHLSERVYGESPEFKKLSDEFNIKLSRKPKPHEILAFIIINTKSFKDFFVNNISYPEIGTEKYLLFKKVALMIIGANIEEDNKILSYQTAIINGLFDADKLDYIMRDTVTAGLSLTYDIDRLFNKIFIHPISTTDGKVEYRLVIAFNGVTAIEELTFCKIMLFSYIYYHQKVLISEYMVEDYITALCESDVIQDISDFLKNDDNSILNLYNKVDKEKLPKIFTGIDLKKLAHNIRERQLPKRSFEVSRANVEYMNGTRIEIDEMLDSLIERIRNETDFNRKEFVKEIINIYPTVMQNGKATLDKLIIDLCDKSYLELLKKRRELYNMFSELYLVNEMDVKFTPFDIYIVFPKDVSYGSAKDEMILGKDRKRLHTINDFIKLDDWAASFNSNKWRGYIFVTENIDRKFVAKACEKFVLKDSAKLKNPEI
ncbi:MAG: HD domain-containing protein [Spirochaetaceae bacterium]|jgi:HD superfamily phosphohydrolase|nr:HD domain-containing protein [Spirochaetaceae bacterium]